MTDCWSVLITFLGTKHFVGSFVCIFSSSDGMFSPWVRNAVLLVALLDCSNPDVLVLFKKSEVLFVLLYGPA